MSKERAARRAERERVAAAQRARLQRQAARRQRRRSIAASVRGWLPRRTRSRRPVGALARRRRTQNVVILGLVLLSQVIVWLLWSDPWVRAAALIFVVLATPVLVTLVLDRRS